MPHRGQIARDHVPAKRYDGYRGKGFPIRKGGRIADLSKHVDKTREGKDFTDLAEAPLDALDGLSKGDAEARQKAFNIEMIRQLAESKHFLRAQAITDLAQAQKK